MKFNSTIWSNYLNSIEGQQSLKFFESLQLSYENPTKDLQSFLKKWGNFSAQDHRLNISEDIADVRKNISKLNQLEKAGLLYKQISSEIDTCRYFDVLFNAKSESEADEDLFYVDDIAPLSIALFCKHPKHFFPYYFYPSFEYLEKICNEFQIVLPSIPKKSDYDERFLFYLEICKILYAFARDNQIKPEHLPVFLYGFAPIVVENEPLDSIAIQKAKRAWIVGAGTKNGDYQFLKSTNEKTITYWTGNQDAEASDIVLMYVLAPQSEIHSIWRVVRNASVEPFRSYYTTIWIGQCVQLKHPVKLADLKNHPNLSKMSLVRSNFQGVNGKQILKSDYDYFLQLVNQLGNSIQNLPKLEQRESVTLELANEHDVETKILEPLLKQLGFIESDWSRQDKIKVGRADRAIPDYLIHPRKDNLGKIENAKFVWEAKFSISNKKQLEKDLKQAISYAKLVGAVGVGLISKEGIWISFESDNYSVKKIQQWSISEINNKDTFNLVDNLVSKKALSKIKTG